ncbi:phosphotransferase enzyme family protein [soil metagenome]
MNNFPVTNSTLSAPYLCFFVQEKYDFSENTACRLLKTGINDTYLINVSSTKYVLRIYSLNWRTETEILEEIRLLNLLKNNGIPVSYPIADLNGNYVQALNAPEGNRFGVLFSFAEGEKLLNFSAELHCKAGEIMAKMHEVTCNLKLDRVEYTPGVILSDSFEHLKKFLSAATDEMEFMSSTQTWLLEEIGKVNTKEIRKGAIHLDIWFDNMSIHQGSGITLFDFDFCGNGWLCYDIAYYILQLSSTEKDETECRLKTEAFLQGYESVNKLTGEEKRILPMLGVSLYFFYLGIQCQRFENWSNTFLNEGYLKRFINLLVKKYFEKNGLGK